MPNLLNRIATRRTLWIVGVANAVLLGFASGPEAVPVTLVYVYLIDRIERSI